MKLRGLLVVEGTAKSMAEVPQEVVEAAVALGYLEGMRRVIEIYKPAAAGRRLVDGVNQAPESVSAFRRFSAEMNALAGDGGVPEFVRALYLHDAASGSAKQNGNLPNQQVELNRLALGMLERVPQARRTDDWWCIFEKVMVGLMEAGHVPFEETVFRQIIDSMGRNKSKDTAGRREFLARWLMEHGRQAEARTVLEPVVEDIHFAPVQLDRARALLTDLD